MSSMYFTRLDYPFYNGYQNSPWVLNVQSYGATGLGVVNDQPAIQATYNAAAALSSNPNGAVVIFPPGTYNISSPVTISGNNVATIAPEFGAQIVNLNLTTDAFQVSSSQGSMEGLYILVSDNGGATPATGGAGVNILPGVTQFRMSNMKFAWCYNNVIFQSSNVFCYRFLASMRQNTAGDGYIFGTASTLVQNITMYDCIAAQSSAPTGAFNSLSIAAFRLVNVSSVFLYNCSCFNYQYAMLCVPGNGSVVRFGDIFGFGADLCTQNGIALAPTGTGQIYNMNFNGVDVLSCGGSVTGTGFGSGIYIDSGASGTVNSVRFVGGSVGNGLTDGVFVNGGVGLTFSGMGINSNSRSAPTYTGIHFNAANTVSDVSVSGCQIGNQYVLGSSSQHFGLYISGGTGYNIVGNNCTGNVAGGLGIGAGFVDTASLISSNAGINPRGVVVANPAPPAVPASSAGTIFATNPFNTSAYVTVATGAGVTISQFYINNPITGVYNPGYTQAASTIGKPIPVQAGEGVALTYAGGTPTWVWQVN